MSPCFFLGYPAFEILSVESKTYLEYRFKLQFRTLDNEVMKPPALSSIQSKKQLLCDDVRHVIYFPRFLTSIIAVLDKDIFPSHKMHTSSAAGSIKQVLYYVYLSIFLVPNLKA